MGSSNGNAQQVNADQDTIPVSSTGLRDSLQNLPYTPSSKPEFIQQDRYGDPFANHLGQSPLLFGDPSNMTMTFQLDTGLNFSVTEKIGSFDYRPATIIPFEEYSAYQTQNLLKTYWQEKSAAVDGETALTGKRLIPKIYISPVFDRIFGGSYVEINPRGSVNLDFGALFQRIENPSLPVTQQKNGGFEFDQQINMNVVGKIGEKLKMTANFDNNNSFDFQNNLKVEFTGFEEDIIKKLEVGNVTMPVSNSLMTGAQNLFGLKTQLQFGKLFVTAVASTQRGKHDEVSIDGGGVQGREFEIKASEYDENRHFFLGHFFRDNYENWLQNIPQITSGIQVTRVEVYIINRNNDTRTQRNIIAFMDLAEGKVIYQKNEGAAEPGLGAVANQNDANQLFNSLASISRNVDQIDGILEAFPFSMIKATHYDKINGARKLEDREFTFHKQLGYISLSRKLSSDEVLAVAYEYSYNGINFKVGELTEDYANRPEDEAIFMKMLRPSKIAPRDQDQKRIPTWDLMMKNVYSLNANQINNEGFQMRITYRDDRTGLDNPSLNEGANTSDVPLIELLGLDQLNANGDRQKDGNFDFVDEVTINSATGNVIFPVLEPFGDHLAGIFGPAEVELIQRYVYDTLYGTTKSEAQQDVNKDKFFLSGSLKSGSTSEINLPGIKIAEGSVVVTAGGITLTEGADYTVDYNFGKVQILNEGIINSGKSIKVTYEKADLFNFQSRSLLGAHFEYRVNNDFNVGATILHHFERPLYTRHSIGNEPPKNTKYGFDINYRKESRFLTKMVDALPLIQTKEPSQITFSGEFAQLIPGTSNLVNGEGTSYIDDFENTATPFGLGNWLQWKTAATPTTTDNKFDLSDGATDDVKFSYKRAKLAWYTVDNIFYRNGGQNLPPNINDADRDNHYVRPISPQEIFPGKNEEVLNTNYPIFDLAYFPAERGIYNYNPDLTSQGILKDPQSNWAGITQSIRSEVDFDKSNIEYIEFWLMDPFIQSTNGIVLDGSANPQANFTGGELIFNLGSISEDIMRDRQMAFENGLPISGEKTIENTTENNWGFVTKLQYINNAFNNEAGARENQDVGLDGLSDEEELSKFSNFIGDLPSNIAPTILDKIKGDPSSDNFKYFLGDEHDQKNAKILERYKNFNGLDQNSPKGSNNTNYSAQGTSIPDNEDLNSDNTLGDLEEYYEYRVNLRPGQLEVGKGFITDKVTNVINGDAVSWYLFRVPISQPDAVIGNISGFKSIRYVRTYFTGWSQPVVLRTANLRLVGSQWRRFEGNLESKRFDVIPETQDSKFTISVVNIEENSQGGESGIPYVLPPGISRDRDNASAIERRLNEQSIQLCIEELQDKNAQAAFKNVDLNLVNYGRIKMFLHAQSNNANNGNLSAFLRLGTGFDNYYEIEVPLNITSKGSSLPDEIWPVDNEINMPFEELYKAKSLRNKSGISIDLPFSTTYNQYKITIVGNPKLSIVTNLMIGVRNPKSDDERTYDICMWANEMRVTDFNRAAGWAGNASLNTKLADFANITASTRFTSFGFGHVQSKIGDRTQETSFEYDISGNVNLDKFLPSKTGIKIPIFASYESKTVTPEYDPLDSDIPLENSLDAIDNSDKREDYKNAVIDLTEQKSINLTNFRKEYTNPNKTKRFFNIENFTVSFAYNDRVRSNYNIQSYQNRNYSGSVAYTYSPQDKSIIPFKNAKGLNSDWLKLIKEFNFNPVLSNVTVRAELRRTFIKTQYRNKDLSTVGVAANYEKSFTFNRIYNAKWSVTKAIALNYSARVNSIIDEPEGEISNEGREIIFDNLKGFGRMKRFDQTVGANLRLPLDKFPITDWTNADVKYSVGYIWSSGSLDQIDTLGNRIENNRTMSATGKFDLVKLYNKVPYLKKINSPTKRRPATRPSAAQDTTKVAKENNGIKGFLRTLMMVRSVNITYSVKDGTGISGFKQSPFLFGMDTTWSSPGLDFILGSQDPAIRHRASNSGWLVDNPSLSAPFKQLQTITLNIKSTIEPIKDFKIQVDMKKSKSAQYQEIYRTDTLGAYQSYNPTRSGSYSLTFLTIKTAFIKDSGSDNISPLFQEFISNRDIVGERLFDQTGINYNKNNQDILIPAFIAAYSGKSAKDVSIQSFPTIPLPNWRLDYSGLGKLPAIRKTFSSFTITHAYSSTFSVNNYSNSGLYQLSDELLLSNDVENTQPATKVNSEGQYVPQFVMQQIVISERFAPLVKISVRTRSRLNASVEYKTERNLALNLSNTQITELNSKDFVLKLGLTKANIKLPFKIKGRTTTLENDFDFRLDLTIKDTKTIQRKFNESTTGTEVSVNTITNGNINVQIRPNVGYALNNRLTLQVYYERSINTPHLIPPYKRTTTAFGVQVRFSLAQ